MAAFFNVWRRGLCPDYMSKKQEVQPLSGRGIKHNRKAQGAGAYTGIMVLYMLANVLTKLLGFGREIFITSRFGYGPVSDGYILGFAVPDLVYRLLVGGAVTAAVTPILSSAIERDEEHKAWRPISTFYTVVLIFSFVFLTLGEVFSGQMIQFLNPNKSVEVLAIATSVSKVIFLQTFFFILIAIINSILSSNKVFGLPVFGDSVYNLICLLAIVFLGAPTETGAVRVAWGIVFAALCYFLYMSSFSVPYIKGFRPNLDVKHPLFRRILWLAIPTLIAGTVNQLNVIIQQGFADQFVGAVTSLRNSQTLYNLPYQTIVVSVGPLLLPNLSGFFARKAGGEASDFFSKSLRSVLFMMVPFVVLFMVAADETVQAVYQWNPAKYTDTNVLATGSLLTVYAINMLLQAVIFFINQTFYARQRSWISLFTGVINLILNPLFCLLYINVFGFGLQSLTLATCSYNLVIIVLSSRMMKRFIPEIKVRGLASFSVRALVAAILSFSVLFFLKALLPASDDKIIQLLQYAVLGLGGLGSYFLAAMALKMPESASVIRMFNQFFNKFRRRKA